MSSESIFTHAGLAREKPFWHYLILPIGALLSGGVLCWLIAHAATTALAQPPKHLWSLVLSGLLLTTAILIGLALLCWPEFIRRSRRLSVQMWPTAAKPGFDYRLIRAGEAVDRNLPTALVASIGGRSRRTTTAWTTHRNIRLELPLRLELVWQRSAVRVRWQLPKRRWWHTTHFLHFAPAQIFPVLVPFLENCSGYAEARYLEAFLELLAQERVSLQCDIAACVEQSRSRAVEVRECRHMAAEVIRAAVAIARVQQSNHPQHPLTEDDQELIQAALALMHIVAGRIADHLPGWPPDQSLVTLVRQLQRHESSGEPSADLCSRLRAAAQGHAPQ